MSSTRRERDWFAIDKLYPTYRDESLPEQPFGEEWHFDDPVNYAQFKASDDVVEDQQYNGMKQYHMINNQNASLEIATSTLFDPDVAVQEVNDLVAVQTDQTVLETQGFMYNTNDWKNVEITGAIKMISFAEGSTAEQAFVDIVVRGARHDESYHGGCEGTGYHLVIRANGLMLLGKELQHSLNGVTTANPFYKIPQTDDLLGKWIFFKFVVINDADGNVRLEAWLDDEPDQRDGQSGNNWVKKLEYTDIGSFWQIGGGISCGSPTDVDTASTRKITWGGPLVYFNWQNFNFVYWKDFSVREIADNFAALSPSSLPAYASTDPCDPTYVPICPTGYQWDAARRVCHRYTPSCPAGQKWDQLQLKCVDDVVDHDCTAGRVWSDQYNKCILTCATGKHYDANLDACVDDIVVPPTGNQIYPTKPGGDIWSLDVDGMNSSRLSIASNVSTVKNADGSYTANVSQGSTNPDYSMRFNISAKTKTSTRELDQARLATQGYMNTAGDWKNIEFTVYVNIQTMNSEDQFDLYSRGGSHTDSNGGCEGTAIKPDFYTSSGAVRLTKELQHTDGYTYGPRVAGKIPSLMNKWVGLKVAVFNYTKPGTSEVVVVVEFYCDPLADGHWQKVYAVTDDGHFCNSSAFCGGTKCQIISWGGPTATIRCDAMRKCMLKGIEIREITPPTNITLPPSITAA